MNKFQTTSTAVPEKNSRHFLSVETDFNSWESLKPFYENLKARVFNNKSDLEKWLMDLSELDSAVSEHLGWIYIHMTCNTQDKSASDAYAHFVGEIQPIIAEYDDAFNRKLLESKFSEELEVGYRIHLASIRNQVRIFRKENIQLIADITVREQKYGEIAGEMTVEVNGKTLTLQQAANFLRQTDRDLREHVYFKIVNRRLIDRKKLDELFNELIQIRHTISLNAGFENFRDYKFVELDRFDYTPADCTHFHNSIQQQIVPIVDAMLKKRKEELKLDALKPWDLDVDTSGKPELKPFKTGHELTKKTIECFYAIDSYFGKVVEALHSMHHLDLDSRIGKAPGGYNYPLYETGVPFIFMNSSGSMQDVVTMVHEGGHAIHSMLTHSLEFVGFKELPSEIAELASMSMELISMEHWNYFFDDEDDLRRAKREQLEGVLEALPWIACVDKFQHWLYLNPGHSIDERTNAWKDIYAAFSSSTIDWNNAEHAREALWQKQLHLFEVPFYYIEYGMAQLGAIAVWRNYKNNPKLAIQQYKEALSLGSTRSISDVYTAAGIRFDFSETYIKELADFVKSELEKV
ncbi:MAG: M3 family oligoendopeptidase [Bacteroidota bacterium]